MSSGSGASPIGESALPSYLARHFDIGFDSDDVSALISSIDASQDRESPPSLPHLPAEILFHIVKYVPVDYILQWRLVCRGFRDCIDGPVMFDYIERAEIIGYLGSPSTLAWINVDEKTRDVLHLVHCRFTHHLEGSNTHTTSRGLKTKWGRTIAVFAIDDAWYEHFLVCHTLPKNGENEDRWLSLLDELQLEGEPEPYGNSRWCMRLDHAVLDLDFSPERLSRKLSFDPLNKRVLIEWRDILFDFLKTETQFRTVMEQKRNCHFSFSHLEDCLRDVRRERLLANLDENVPDQYVTRWGLGNLPALFGQRNRYELAEEYQYLENAENSSMNLLIPLRREAAMSKKDKDELWQLAKDRNEMATALQNIEMVYEQWRTTLCDTTSYPSSNLLPKVPTNPCAWNDDLRKTEEARVLKWKAQQENMQQVVRLLEASIEAVSVPENAFDEPWSDI